MCARRLLKVGVRLASAGWCVLVTVGLTPARAEIPAQLGGPTGGGAIVGDTPVAIAIAGPSGAAVSWHRSDDASGPHWTCGYYSFENDSTSGWSIAIDYSGGPRSPVAGEAYALLCHDDGGELVYSWFGVYDPADPFSGLMASARAAELALAQLDLAPPRIRMNPPGDQLVGLPSWFWVDTPWEPAEASARVSGVGATVTAVPERVEWTFGDGATSMCHGPGSVYDPRRPSTSQSSDCTHVFTSPSSRRPSGSFPVTATVWYSVSWHATDGRGDTLGEVHRTGTTEARAVEVQAVIR